MDFLKKAQSALQGNSGSHQQQQQQPQGNFQGQPQQQGQPGAAAGASTGQKDYGDKALDFLEKKTGHHFSDQQNEKITDGVRGFYEKQTGKKVDPKWSN